MSIFQKKHEGFEQAVAPYERQVYFTCLRIMGNRQDAEDCAQEAMVKAYKNYHTFRGQASLGTWLYTIAARCCMDALRKRKKDVSLDSLQEEGWDQADDAPSPYLQLEEGERKKALEQGIDKLSPDQRLALVLCDLQSLSYEEAAAVMECPIGTVRSRLYRARQNLKSILSSHMELFSTSERQSSERGKTE